MRESTIDSCPYCNSDRSSVEIDGLANWFVKCSCCAARGPTKSKLSDAIGMWNLADRRETEILKRNGEPVYIVWSPTGHTPPRVTHTTPESALEAASAQARDVPGHEFNVCKVVMRVKLPIREIELTEWDDQEGWREYDDCPF